MREVLFRAKRTGLNGWIEGFVSSPFRDTMCLFYELSTGKEWYVDDYTVGQYTGVNDKNGKMVFEGDIVNCNGNFCIVRFGKHNIYCCGCCFEYHSSIGFYLECGEEYDNKFAADENTWNDLYVIGNIYDNPELLKGGD